MNCRFCNAEMEEESSICPVCGKCNTEEPQILAEQENEPSEELSEEFSDVEEMLDEESEEQSQKPKRKLWQILLTVGCCLVLLAALTLVILHGMGIDIGPRDNNVQYKDSYTFEDDKAVKDADKVIATVGDMKLTNSELQIYYTLQVYDYVQYYSSILSYLGLDYTQPLSEQTCYFDETMTWQQYFLDISIQTWQRYAILNLLAKEAGCELSESDQQELNNIPQELEELAAEYDFESAEAFIQANYGVNCNMDSYLSYVYTFNLGELFYQDKSEEFMPDLAEIEAYYAENEAAFQESGVTKDSGPIVDVRHILVIPEGGTTDEAGETTYSDAQWAACLAEAEKILAEWKAGEATEDSFAALATTYTEDPGSQTTGGLYEGITPDSSYVENFLNWAVDTGRQAGDTGIVQSNYGYHIMYFVDGEDQWISAGRTNLLAERVSEMIEEAMERWPMNVNYKKITLSTGSIAQ